MPNRTLFWCGDDCFRYCYVSKILEAMGLKVLVPAKPPSIQTLKLPRRGSLYSHFEVISFLEKYNCINNNIINCLGGRPKTRSRGDIDVLAVSNNLVVVLEVKSRIIPRILSGRGADATRLMLEYHLDDPMHACLAWTKLVKQGVVENRQDSPSSVFELIREATHVILERKNNGLEIEDVIVGSAIPFYGAPFYESILTYVERSARYISNCLKLIVLPAVFIIIPVNLEMPYKVRVACYGEGCDRLGFSKPTTIVLSTDTISLIRMYETCNKCRYRFLCYSIWRNNYNKNY